MRVRQGRGSRARTSLDALESHAKHSMLAAEKQVIKEVPHSKTARHMRMRDFEKKYGKLTK